MTNMTVKEIASAFGVGEPKVRRVLRQHRKGPQRLRRRGRAWTIDKAKAEALFGNKEAPSAEPPKDNESPVNDD